MSKKVKRRFMDCEECGQKAWCVRDTLTSRWMCTVCYRDAKAWVRESNRKAKRQRW